MRESITNLSESEGYAMVSEDLPLQPMIQNPGTNPQALLDQEGVPHRIEIGPGGLLLDALPASIVKVSQGEVYLFNEQGTCICSTEAFWKSLVGGQAPTAEDAGLVLAQLLDSWMRGHRAAAMWQSFMEQAADITMYSKSLLLPARGQDAFQQRVLESYDGSPASIAAIALVLHAQASQVQRLLEEKDLPLPTLIAPDPLAEQGRGPFQGEDPAAPDTGPGKAAEKGKRFRWTADMTAQLETAFLESEETTPAERISAIASRYGWPRECVQYKVYELKLPQQWRQAHARETADQPETQEEDGSRSERSAT